MCAATVFFAYKGYNAAVNMAEEVHSFPQHHMILHITDGYLLIEIDTIAFVPKSNSTEALMFIKSLQKLTACSTVNHACRPLFYKEVRHNVRAS